MKMKMKVTPKAFAAFFHGGTTDTTSISQDLSQKKITPSVSYLFCKISKLIEFVMKSKCILNTTFS
ncbi:hypothetical protein BVRB_4g080690 isoform A [Beta vulgaris subsp. vulgaris]|nr:hypothetical protein BVRB_4g080690 isoform A [Beta vulgaris subsp. vulgaris]